MSVTLRQLQLCELEALKDFKKVCENNRLCYYLSSGTLLDAVRHQGFIPWDDDIDIEMPYKDYLRFIGLGQNALGDKYFLQTSETDPFFPFAFSRIRINNTTMMREWEKEIPTHHGVWIDIFPLTYVGGEFEFRLKRLMIRTATFLQMDEFSFTKNEKWYIERSNAFQVMLVKVIRKLPSTVRAMIRNVMLKYVFAQKEKPYLSTVWTNITYKIPREVFDEPHAEMRFENDVFAVPKNYASYLSIVYGDYMTPPPENQRDGGHGELILDLEHQWRPDTEFSVGAQNSL